MFTVKATPASMYPAGREHKQEFQGAIPGQSAKPARRHTTRYSRSWQQAKAGAFWESSESAGAPSKYWLEVEHNTHLDDRVGCAEPRRLPETRVSIPRAVND